MRLWNFWLFERKLSAAVNPEKRVKVQGVIFRVRKLQPMDHIAGAKTLRASFAVYKTGATPEEVATAKAVKAHYIDTFMAAVIEPKLTRKHDPEDRVGIWVENLFTDWELATELYSEIIAFTYGKKKLTLAHPSSSRASA